MIEEAYQKMVEGEEPFVEKVCVRIGKQVYPHKIKLYPIKQTELMQRPGGLLFPINLLESVKDEKVKRMYEVLYQNAVLDKIVDTFETEALKELKNIGLLILEWSMD